MLFFSSHSVVRIVFDDKKRIVKFSTYRYNKGKSKFKKRYELTYPNTGIFFLVYNSCIENLDRVLELRDVVWKPIDLYQISSLLTFRMVPICIIMNSKTNICQVLRIDYECGVVVFLSQFHINGNPFGRNLDISVNPCRSSSRRWSISVFQIFRYMYSEYSRTYWVSIHSFKYYTKVCLLYTIIIKEIRFLNN